MKRDPSPESRVEAALWRTYDSTRSTPRAFAGSPDRAAESILAAYATAKMLGAGYTPAALGEEGLRAYVPANIGDEALRSALLDGGFVEFWERALRFFEAEGCGEAELRDYVLSDGILDRGGRASGELATPASVRRLALAVLGIEGGDRVADLCCGIGGFLADASGTPGVELYGVEGNIQAAIVAKARLDLLGADFTIETADAFMAPREGEFDKVFSNYPWGARVAHMGGVRGYLERLALERRLPGRPASADWLFNKLAFDSLAPGGTAVTVMSNGAAFNGSDERTRRYFVQNRMVRAAVALPPDLFRAATIPNVLLVLGENEGPVRMVDASGIYVPGRRQNTLGEEEIAEIVELLEEDSEESRAVDVDEIAWADWSLFPPRYVGRSLELVNPEKLGDLAISIDRGATMRASELDALTVEVDTGFCYLRLSDIEDGCIAGDLPHMSPLDESTRRCWLRTGDLLLSKNGAPFKVAVAEVPEGQTIIANGNLYIVRLDTSRVDPWFVAAYLSSEDGKAALEQMVVGTTIPNLPMKNLKGILIPVLSEKQQRAIADRYRSAVDEIEVLKLRVSRARDAAASAYGEVTGR